MQRNVVTILGVIVAIVIAWLLVDVALRVAFFLWKAAIVAVVAVVVFFVLRALLTRRDTSD
jgi:putative flippase GtrA